MNRGRNGGDRVDVTHTARSAFAARTCDALPFRFHRASVVRRAASEVIIPVPGVAGSGARDTTSPGAMGL